MLLTLRINPAFKKQIYDKLINPYSLVHTIRTVGNKLIIHQDDLEFVDKVLERNSLRYRIINNN